MNNKSIKKKDDFNFFKNSFNDIKNATTKIKKSIKKETPVKKQKYNKNFKNIDEHLESIENFEIMK